jgi:hypothetical protein
MGKSTIGKSSVQKASGNVSTPQKMPMSLLQAVLHTSASTEKKKKMEARAIQVFEGTTLIGIFFINCYALKNAFNNTDQQFNVGMVNLKARFNSAQDVQAIMEGSTADLCPSNAAHWLVFPNAEAITSLDDIPCFNEHFENVMKKFYETFPGSNIVESRNYCAEDTECFEEIQDLLNKFIKGRFFFETL